MTITRACLFGLASLALPSVCFAFTEPQKVAEPSNTKLDRPTGQPSSPGERPGRAGDHAPSGATSSRGIDARQAAPVTPPR